MPRSRSAKKIDQLLNRMQKSNSQILNICKKVDDQIEYVYWGPKIKALQKFKYKKRQNYI